MVVFNFMVKVKYSPLPLFHRRLNVVQIIIIVFSSFYFMHIAKYYRGINSVYILALSRLNYFKINIYPL